MLDLKNVSKTFHPGTVNARTALNDLTLHLDEGDFVTVIGGNGAGKSTMQNAICGTWLPDAGEILLDGVRIDGMGQEKINRLGIARTFQNIRLFNNMTVVRNVMVGLHNKEAYNTNFAETVLRLPRHFRVEKEMREEAKSLLRIFGLEDVRNELAANLPYGKQRKLEIARALATGPKLLLLDEPAAGMNPHETEELTGTIRQVRDRFGMTILLIEHDMSLVSGICDELTVLNFGTTLAQGATAEVLKNPEVVKAYLGD